MSQHIIAGYLKVLSAVPKVLHNGTNGEAHRDRAESFMVQAVGETFLGNETVSGISDGFRIQAGQTVDCEALYSRGTHSSFDFTKMYYIGGPWTLIIMEKA